MSSSLVVRDSDTLTTAAEPIGEASDLQQDAIDQFRSAMEDPSPSIHALHQAVKANKSLVRSLRDEAFPPGTPPQQAEFLLALAAACVCAQACDNVSLYVEGLRRRAARSHGYSPSQAIDYHRIALRCINRMLGDRQIAKSHGHTRSETEHLYNQAFITELDLLLLTIGTS